MACRCISSFRNPYNKFSRLKAEQFPPQARFQSFPEEGNCSDRVEANMSVLRQRMERVRVRESIDTRYREGNGWNYGSRYDDVRRKHNMLMMSIELVTMVCTTIGVVFVSGSLCIFLLSLIFSLWTN